MTALLLAFLAGAVVGVFLAVGWAATWAAGDVVVDRLLAPGFDAHADQAIAVSTNQEATR